MLLVLLTLPMLPHSGSKLVINGQNLDSGYRAVVQYTSTTSSKTVDQVSLIYITFKMRLVGRRMKTKPVLNASWFIQRCYLI